MNNDDDDGNGVADYADPGPLAAADNDLVPFELRVNQAGLAPALVNDLRATLEFDPVSTGVRVWDSPTKQVQVALPATWVLADLPSTLFAEGINGDNVFLKLTLKRQSTGQIFGTDSIRVTVNYINLIGYRPQTTPLVSTEVPFSQEENPGVYIRRNGDDDDGNGTPDLMDTSVTGEDDLIQVNLDTSVGGTGVRYVLQKTLGIRLWTSSTKGTEVLPMQTSGTFTYPPGVVWVEWVLPGTGAATATLTFGLQDPVSGNQVDLDRLVFHPFTSIVIVIGGRTQVPSDPIADPTYGTFQTAIDLYREGYDVHMYNEAIVANDGTGVPYNEVVSAIENRGVTSVAIFGYSYGGGATFLVAGPSE